MTKQQLEELWKETLQSNQPSQAQFDDLAEAVVDPYRSGHVQFRQHLENRSKRVAETTGVAFEAEDFDLAMARAYIADELGFAGWSELTAAVT